MTYLTVLWAFLANLIAYKKGYYKLPKTSLKTTPYIQNQELVVCFAIYLALSLVLAPLFAKFLLTSYHKINPEITSLPIPFLTFLQFLNMAVVFVLLQLYIHHRNSTVYGRIWKDRQYGSTRPIEFDLGIGVLTWVLAFPVVTVLADLIDKLVKEIFGETSFEQTAVQFVKIASSSPLALFFALIAVLVLAPFIEEFLFRGLLQTHLKKRMGPKSAILISALVFALFHFSLSQGVGNISLVFSLFLLGGYLGFLYERQGSLWASIGLHMTFNVVSAMRILFLPESI